MELSGNLLTVSGERTKETKNEGEGRYFAERSYGRFERSFTLPSDVKAENLEANYQDGVLHLAIPKAEGAKRQKIQIGETKPGWKEKFLGKGKEKEAPAQTKEKAA